ncbi:MAG: ABC transporter ATP-binding protein [Candidatus Dormibacteria bacterium]
MATAAIDSGASRTQRRRGVTLRGLRISASYIRAHPLPFAIAVTGATLYAAMTVASTIVLGRVTDRVLVPAFAHGVSGTAIAFGVLAVLVVALLRAVGIMTRRFFAGTSQHRNERTLRRRVLAHYARLPLAYHQSHPTGELLAHTQADVQAACMVLGPLPYTTAVLSLVVFATVAMLLTDPLLALIGCTALPLLALLNQVYSRRVEPPQTRAQQRIGEVSAVAHESIDGALVVKTLGRESAEIARFGRSVDGLRAERVDAGRIRAGFNPALEALPDGAMILLVAVGCWQISRGTVSIGTLVEFVSLFQLLAMPLRMIGYVLSDLARVVVGRERIEEVLRTPVPLIGAAAHSATPLPPGPLALAVEAIDAGYDGAAVLHGLNLSIAAGASVALVGPTGSGKSTLAALLVRLADPQRGRIALGGVDLRELTTGELRSAVAIVFQESFLFATTVRENIALGIEVNEAEIVAAARTAQAHDFISSMPQGYDTVLGERGVTVSGGQRQRIALARALLRRPRFLILDDATSAVDPTVEAAILDGLQERLETTLLVVAHRASTIGLAERIVLLEDGRISATGTHSELLEHPTYAAIVRAHEREAA